MKIVVYAICRDEAAFASRFMTACADADAVVIADTGSTDDGPAAFAALGAQVHRIAIAPWRFDDARNAALALVPGDADLCLSLDVDEVPAPGWRAAIEAGWTPQTTRGSYLFVASHTADGGDGAVFWNTRLHRRHGYRWRHACHEGLYPDRLAEVITPIEGLRVDHWPDPAKSRALYLGVLEQAVAEEPAEPRMAHYLAREYWYAGRYRDAIAEFARYLALPDSRFADERCASTVLIGQCHEALGEDGDGWFHRAVAEAPWRREPWVSLAESAYRREDWASCHADARRALALPLVASGYPSDPHCFGPTPDDLAAIGGWHLGLRPVALAHAEAALALAPDDARLRANVAFMLAEADGPVAGS